MTEHRQLRHRLYGYDEPMVGPLDAPEQAVRAATRSTSASS